MKKLLILLLAAFMQNCTAKSVSSEDKAASQTAQVLDQIAPVKNINSTEAKQLLTNDKNAIIVDVRSNEEVAQGKVDNSIHIPITDPDFVAKMNALDKTKTVIVYCKAGGRSAKACKMVEGKGFKSLYNVTDGFDGWKSN